MKYTKTHEWIEIYQANIAKVGISAHAQKELGEIVYVELPQVGKSVKAGQEVAVLESVKAAADVYAPVSGTIQAINEALKTQPELVNEFSEGEGWLYAVSLSDPTELAALMDRETYQKQLP